MPKILLRLNLLEGYAMLDGVKHYIKNLKRGIASETFKNVSYNR